jgi:5-methylcytosine-specific restriction endonuclease McrA
VAAEDGPHIRLEVDHITPRAHGGTNDPSNFWTLCFACNRGKGVKEL